MPTDKTIPRERGAYSFLTPVTLRYSDQDPNQHINNVAITAYLESGRVGFMHNLFGDRLPDSRMVLANMTVDYLQEILYPDTVEVGGRLAAVGGRSITCQYAIFQGDKCCVVSQSTNVFFNPETRRSMEPPDDIRQHLDEQMAALT
ncbi:acyl-CoA thioesterase [Hoeflea sp. WL0058]|uniref:Acyl-CoA thioesterase n=1 Tax=Flavimaribacter sediminis TaxID=2865987 RepID=A0AAE3CZM3_9HYPH|nr:thioesterase family protein [Flavimaribacter sediminis]MBW8636112.1 acyl-CoA thioesterase [Flavimaribacter sediminis]